jgi:hypothetical protein
LLGATLMYECLCLLARRVAG